MRRIKIEIAANILLTLFSAVIVFHILVLFGVIPYHIVWGGRLESKSQTYLLETISIALNLFIISVICMKAGYMRVVLGGRVISVLLWVFVVLFSANTIGNIFSNSTIEAIVFTPITAVSAFLLFRIAIEKRE